MEDYRGKDREKEEVYSKAVKAGKRTYFMDVKETKSGDLYLTITESKRIFDENLNKFIYDKHKIFLYKEDFENFVTGLQQTIRFIETGELPPEEPDLCRCRKPWEKGFPPSERGIPEQPGIPPDCKDWIIQEKPFRHGRLFP